MTQNKQTPRTPQHDPALCACCAEQVQINPDPTSRLEEFFWGADVFFNCVFLVELLFNMFGTWFEKFWSDGWNVFDFVVVVLSAISMISETIPGPFCIPVFHGTSVVCASPFVGFPSR